MLFSERVKTRCLDRDWCGKNGTINLNFLVWLYDASGKSKCMIDFEEYTFQLCNMHVDRAQPWSDWPTNYFSSDPICHILQSFASSFIICQSGILCKKHIWSNRSFLVSSVLSLVTIEYEIVLPKILGPKIAFLLSCLIYWPLCKKCVTASSVFQ